MPQEETLDVLAYLRRLAKYLIPAAVIGLVVGALAGFLTRPGAGATVSEKAHVLVMPQTPTTDAQATQQAQLISMMMRTYVALEDAPEYTKAVADATHGKYTQEQVANDLTIYWGGGSALLAFQAEGPSKDDADLLANTGAEVFTRMAGQMVPAKAQWNPTLTVVERSVPMDAATTTSGGGLTSTLGTGLGAFVVTTLIAAAILEALANARRRRSPEPRVRDAKGSTAVR